LSISAVRGEKRKKATCFCRWGKEIWVIAKRKKTQILRETGRRKIRGNLTAL